MLKTVTQNKWVLKKLLYFIAKGNGLDFVIQNKAFNHRFSKYRAFENVSNTPNCNAWTQI